MDADGRQRALERHTKASGTMKLPANAISSDGDLIPILERLHSIIAVFRFIDERELLAAVPERVPEQEAFFESVRLLHDVECRLYEMESYINRLVSN